MRYEVGGMRCEVGGVRREVREAESIEGSFLGMIRRMYFIVDEKKVKAMQCSYDLGVLPLTLPRLLWRR